MAPSALEDGSAEIPFFPLCRSWSPLLRRLWGLEHTAKEREGDLDSRLLQGPSLEAPEEEPQAADTEECVLGLAVSWQLYFRQMRAGCRRGPKKHSPSHFWDITPSFNLRRFQLEAPETTATNPVILCSTGLKLREVMANTRSHSPLVIGPGPEHPHPGHSSCQPSYGRTSGLQSLGDRLHNFCLKMCAICAVNCLIFSLN